MMNNISKIMKKAIDWLSETSYPYTGFSHPLDANRVKEAAKALCSWGETLDEDVKSYCRTLNWPESAIETLQKDFELANNGKLAYKEYSEQYFKKYWNIKDDELKEKSWLESIFIDHLWGRKRIDWSKLKQVNILVGINGSGKTSFLNIINDLVNIPKKKNNQVEVDVNPSKNLLAPITFVRTIDNSLVDKKKNESVLSQQLKKVINQNPEEASFFNYLLRSLVDFKQTEIVKRNVSVFLEIVNSFFEETGKRAMYDFNPARLFFTNDRLDEIGVEQLSSGEKQLLLILLQVFLQEKQKSILLMDEPEVSLHISWQQKLIDTIIKLNPNCQLIVATHSPSMFGNGWGDKIVFMEDIARDEERD